jgi:hypothetical protein
MTKKMKMKMKMMLVIVMLRTGYSMGCVKHYALLCQYVVRRLHQSLAIGITIWYLHMLMHTQVHDYSILLFETTS